MKISHRFVLSSSLGSRLTQLDKTDHNLRAAQVENVAKAARKRQYTDMLNSRELAISQRVVGAMMHSEKAHEEHVEMPVSIGSDIMRKMGWREGSGLGREGNEGEAHHRPAPVFTPRAGLGAAGARVGVVGDASMQLRDLSPAQALQDRARRVTEERYRQIVEREERPKHSK